MPVMALPPHRRAETRWLLERCREALALPVLTGTTFAVPQDHPDGMPYHITRVPFLQIPLTGTLLVFDGQRERRLAPGAAAFFVPQSMCRSAGEPGTRILRLTWDVDLLFIAESHHRPGERADPRSQDFITGRDVIGPSGSLAEQLHQRLGVTTDGGAAGERDDRESGALITALVVDAMDRLRADSRERPQAPERWQQAVAWMRRNLAGEVTRKRAAGTIGVHPNHLSRMLRQHCDAGFSELLRRLRLERAEELLLSTDLDLETIARATGFRDRNYLIRVFKSFRHTTPGAWRVHEGGRRISESIEERPS